MDGYRIVDVFEHQKTENCRQQNVLILVDVHFYRMIDVPPHGCPQTGRWSVSSPGLLDRQASMIGPRHLLSRTVRTNHNPAANPLILINPF